MAGTHRVVTAQGERTKLFCVDHAKSCAKISKGSVVVVSMNRELGSQRTCEADWHLEVDDFMEEDDK